MRAAALALILCIVPASAQHNHDHGHDDYKIWRSEKAPHSCCNFEDCQEMEDASVGKPSTGDFTISAKFGFCLVCVKFGDHTEPSAL